MTLFINKNDNTLFNGEKYELCRFDRNFYPLEQGLKNLFR